MCRKCLGSVFEISCNSLVGNLLATPCMHFKILFCVNCNLLTFDIAVPLHTGDAYVILGRITALYKINLLTVDKLDFLLSSGYIDLKQFTAFVRLASMCMPKLSLWSIVIRKYFTSVFRSMIDPLNTRCCVGTRFGDLLNLNKMACVFSLFTLIFHFLK